MVFVGDAGSTEPNDASRRFGAEFALFWRPLPGVTVDGTAAYTRARFRGAAPGQAFIPGATPFVLGGGISASMTPSLTATLRIRHFASAPLIEDNSQKSDATTLMNLGVYREAGRLRLGIDLLNLFNARDPDITYFYASRLRGEPAGEIDDRYIHPVEPRQVRVTARFLL
nr:TonB-dependent receptor [Novosphingobium olei]